MKLLSTEKAIMKIETENLLTFEVDKRKNKKEIKEEIEKILSVKIADVKTLIRGSRKIAYVKLKKEFNALDVATKLGVL